MITFITDRLLSPQTEPDIIAGHEHKDLVLTPIGRSTPETWLRFTAPTAGWSHEALCTYADRMDHGDAYLMDPNAEPSLDVGQFVGSSEI